MAKLTKRYRTFGGIVGNMELKTLSTGKELLAFGVGICVDPGSENLNWMNCKAWDGMARALVDQLNKGDKIVINGPVDEYQGKWSVTVHAFAVIKPKTED